MPTLGEAWALLKAIPEYYHDTECDDPACEETTCGPQCMIRQKHFILMGDVWGWALSDSIELTDKNVQRIAELYTRYGFCGILYYQCKELREHEKSEFLDNNRFIEFVANEEKIRKEVPDFNTRGYAKYVYTIGEEATSEKSTNPISGIAKDLLTKGKKILSRK